ncbi:hypothetical protein KC19_5G104400 [Ceratodon purpureus]|uniref:Ycf15 n=1 Tax=Ceratodon purpureus TaxID=3225 RepID=A0A8T0I1P9_CERPU|nr:hypothetical protein KC19_5G104400 [Ceratodon purpureus]
MCIIFINLASYLVLSLRRESSMRRNKSEVQYLLVMPTLGHFLVSFRIGRNTR